MSKRMSMKDRQAKGQRLQKSTAKKIVELNPDLTSEDVKSCPPYKHGSDIIFSGKAKRILNIKMECKNHGRFKVVYSNYEYGTKHDEAGESILIVNDEGGKTPEGKDREPLAIMNRDYYLELLITKERYEAWIKNKN